jgi:hypothetical protein
LETNLLETDLLTINGTVVDGSQIPSLLQKTQNQAAVVSPPNTTFTGSFNTTNITTNGGNMFTSTCFADNVSSTSVSGNVTFSGALTNGSTVNVSSTSISGGNLMQILQGSLSASNSVNLFLGVANTTNNGSTHQFNYVASGSTSNNMIIKVVGGTSQLQITGTGSVITGPFFIGSLAYNPRNPFTPGNAANVNSVPFSWAGTTNVCRVELSLNRLERYNAATSDVIIQFGTSPSTWHTATYAGQTFSWVDPAISSYWGTNASPTVNGIQFSGSLVWGTDAEPRTWSGKLECTYMGKTGTQEIWGISGMFSQPEVWLGIGPLMAQYVGHFKAPANQTVNMIRIINVNGAEVFRKGDVSILTE